ncbi:hypothetical protein GQ54DRAFT_295788 [Martensiomyces pterosporus]|nr:hypothetical protein GQ54DRAFT_295788 [Martensiomyces pterosporus]
MRKSPITSIETERTAHSSMHSSAYTATTAAIGASRLQQQQQQQQQQQPSPGTNAQTLLSPAELTSMYARQFAATKTAAPTIYQAAAAASALTAQQTYTHGLTVLRCARSRAPVDPHVYRDWLIFEERLKQSYRRLQKKKRSYLAQIIAFGILVLYFAWFGFFGTKTYRFTCKLLSAGSAYCIYLIATNRKFLQSVKYPAQCNRVLHQFRMRFEANPLQSSRSLLAAPTVPSTATSSGATHDEGSNVAGSDGGGMAGTAAKPPSFLAEAQLAFFPTVPQQLRDGYLEFKATYYRKRDAAKRRQQERLRREKQRKNSTSMASFKTNERKPKRRSHHQIYSQAGGVSQSSEAGSGGSLPASLAAAGGGGGAAAAGPLLAGIESATDDGSTTSSSVVSRGPGSGAGRRMNSRLIYALPEHLSNSESDAQDDVMPLSRHAQQAAGSINAMLSPNAPSAAPAHPAVYWSKDYSRDRS